MCCSSQNWDNAEVHSGSTPLPFNPQDSVESKEERPNTPESIISSISHTSEERKNSNETEQAKSRSSLIDYRQCGVIKAGWLIKPSTVFDRRRFFVLNARSRTLTIFRSETSHNPILVVDLNQAPCELLDWRKAYKRDFFTLVVRNQKVQLIACTPVEEEHQDWLACLGVVVNRVDAYPRPNTVTEIFSPQIDFQDKLIPSKKSGKRRTSCIGTNYLMDFQLMRSRNLLALASQLSDVAENVHGFYNELMATNLSLDDPKQLEHAIIVILSSHDCLLGSIIATFLEFFKNVFGAKSPGVELPIDDVISWAISDVNSFLRRLASLVDTLLARCSITSKNERIIGRAVRRVVFAKLSPMLVPLYDAKHKELNQKLLHQCHLLGHVTPKDLDIIDSLWLAIDQSNLPADFVSECELAKELKRSTYKPYQKVVQQLQEISRKHDPIQKIKLITTLPYALCKCVDDYVNFCKELHLPIPDVPSSISPDDLLCLFGYLVIHSQIPNLYSHAALAHDFASEHTKLTMAGYYLTTLFASMDWVLKMDPADYSLSVSRHVFAHEETHRVSSVSLQDI